MRSDRQQPPAELPPLRSDVDFSFPPRIIIIITFSDLFFIIFFWYERTWPCWARRLLAPRLRRTMPPARSAIWRLLQKPERPAPQRRPVPYSTSRQASRNKVGLFRDWPNGFTDSPNDWAASAEAAPAIRAPNRTRPTEHGPVKKRRRRKPNNSSETARTSPYQCIRNWIVEFFSHFLFSAIAVKTKSPPKEEEDCCCCWGSCLRFGLRGLQRSIPGS